MRRVLLSFLLAAMAPLATAQAPDDAAAAARASLARIQQLRTERPGDEQGRP